MYGHISRLVKQVEMGVMPNFPLSPTSKFSKNLVVLIRVLWCNGQYGIL